MQTILIIILLIFLLGGFPTGNWWGVNGAPYGYAGYGGVGLVLVILIVLLLLRVI